MTRRRSIARARGSTGNRPFACRRNANSPAWRPQERTHGADKINTPLERRCSSPVTFCSAHKTLVNIQTHAILFINFVTVASLDSTNESVTNFQV